MSTNFTNEQRLGFTRNYSNYIIERYIKFEHSKLTPDQQNTFVKKINEQLWKEIQNINMRISDRILPFVVVRRIVGEDNNTIRVIINDPDYSIDEIPEYKTVYKNTLTHIALFETLEPRRIIKVWNPLSPGNAKLFIGERDQIAAAVDIFLDIAMFHSYSFLDKMTPEDKQAFNTKKTDYYEEKQLTHYYQIDKKNPPTYFSFSFAARLDEKSIDYEYYIMLWDGFIKYYYSNYLNVVPNVGDQLRYHSNPDQIPKEYRNGEHWKGYSDGAYLLVRVEKKPNDTTRQEMIRQRFSAEQFRIGIITVIPLSEFFHPFWQQQFQELNVSAFKIVIKNNSAE